MQNLSSSSGGLPLLALAIAGVLSHASALAQAPAQSATESVTEGASDSEEPTQTDEIVVTGRLLGAAEALVEERIELPFSADFLAAETITQAGDSNIGAALRRVPGLTLVDGKFVYVRGLGERYSSVTFNGAAVPSPDLSRSVLPLDLFPTSIVESIKIQKSPSPDQPAAFGGGAIDIRTSSIPEGPILSASVGLGFNTESDGDGIGYGAGSTPMSQAIRDAIGTYRGDLSISNILATLNASGGGTLDQARAIHQGLLDSIDKRVGIQEKSLDPDLDGKIAIGNSWDITSDWRVGALANVAYNHGHRNENQRREGVGNPQENFVDIAKTVEEERRVGSLNAGISYAGEHTLEFGAYLLQNDEDETTVSRGFDANNQFPTQKLGYSTRLEERELQIFQVNGNHMFANTPWIGSVLEMLHAQDIEFDWLYSDSKATTDIPNETDFQAQALLNSGTGAVDSTQLLASTSAGKFSFLELEDDQQSWRGDISFPFSLGNAEISLSGGWAGTKKSRQYTGYIIGMDTVGIQSGFLSGTPGDVLGSGNVTVGNGFRLSLSGNTGKESYIAAQRVDAGYGMFDVNFNETWRFTAGARYEQFQQAVLPVNLLDFTGAWIVALQNQLSDPNQTLAIQEDDVYPSFAATYIGGGLFGSSEYQVRLSYGATVVRPDLREVADVIYIDPELDVRVQGNPLLRSSDIDNLELRSEFYYGSGDNFTVSLFYKDIDAPIEAIRAAGSDDDFVIGFDNALVGEVYGIEIEGLKQLPWGLFLQGNLTLSDSEIQFDPNLSTTLTNQTRRLSGHSDYVVNTTLGWDASSGRHSAYLSYNIFGERIFFAGTSGNEDAVEKPFNSLGLVYNFYPVDSIELGFKVDNILNEKREFEQGSSGGEIARIVDQDIGTSVSMSAKWSF